MNAAQRLLRVPSPTQVCSQLRGEPASVTRDPRWGAPIHFVLLGLCVVALFGCDPRGQDRIDDTDDDDSGAVDDEGQDVGGNNEDIVEGPPGDYGGSIAGAALASINGEPWDAPCSGTATTSLDDSGTAQGTFSCVAEELTLPIEGYFQGIALPGESPAQLQVGESTVFLEWGRQDGEPAIALTVEGTMPGPVGSDLSATIEITGVLGLQ